MAAVEQLVTDYLDLWTAAIKRRSAAGRGSSRKIELYGVKKLRELILELAVRGLLVPQASNDETASELLKMIAAEKAKLLKEGKIKKEKPLPTVEDAEMPFDIPANWAWVRLGEIGFTQTGGTPKKSDSNHYGNDVPFIKPGDIIDGEITSYENDGLTFDGATDLGRIAPPDSILMVCIGTIGKCARTDRSVTFNQQINSVSPYLPLGRYIKQVLQSGYFQRLAWKNSASTTISILNKGKWEAIPLPLAPHAEQHRIVAKVDELMALCDQLEAQTDASLSAHQILVETLLSVLTDTGDHAQFATAWQRIAEHFDTLFTTEESIDQLKQTILQLAVMGKLVPQDPNDEPASELLKRISAEKAELVKEGKIRNAKPLPPIAATEKPFQLPSGWAFCRLQELVSILGDGLHGTPSYDDDGDYFFINGNNLNDGAILIKPDTKRVGLGEFERHKKELNSRTVLISINGTIGNVAFFNDEQVILGKSACYFNLLSGIEKLYIKRFVESPLFFRYASSQATATTISNLGLKAINSFPIPVPPTTEQQRIIAKVDELFALCDQLKFRLTDAQVTQLHLADALAEKALARA
jgi:type I restriction enzyme, S subunit